MFQQSTRLAGLMQPATNTDTMVLSRARKLTCAIPRLKL